jgi:hypothetical protein
MLSVAFYLMLCCMPLCCVPLWCMSLGWLSWRPTYLSTTVNYDRKNGPWSWWRCSRRPCCRRGCRTRSRSFRPRRSWWWQTWEQRYKLFTGVIYGRRKINCNYYLMYGFIMSRNYHTSLISYNNNLQLIKAFNISRWGLCCKKFTNVTYGCKKKGCCGHCMCFDVALRLPFLLNSLQL